uniref:Transposase (Putative), gypsy type n=1 Tax=Tanacetum cinerariifolium TaxID=118510 RepID=A0A6L2J3D2_TANCI|nr:hypothetical protein [Tanacetum cinerariifolium]
MSFIKRFDAAPVCYSKPLDSVKNWNDHFFRVDSTAFPLSVSLKSKILSKDPLPKLSRYDIEACEFLRTHTSPFWKFSEPFLCWVGISRYYTLEENSYLTFWDGEEGGYILFCILGFIVLLLLTFFLVAVFAEMDLFAFIRHSDPTKVRIGEQNLTDREVKLLKMTEGRTILLDPPVTATPEDSGDTIDKMFDEGNDANQEQSVGKDDDVLEEVGVEKAKKKQKRKITEGVSSFVYPPKKLLDDDQSLPPLTGRKSLFALRGMVSEGSTIPSDVAEPLVTAFVTPMSDVGPVDYVSGLNYRLVLPISAVDVPVVTVFVTTTIDANVATSSKAKDAPKDFEHIGDFASACGVDADAASISNWKVTNDSVLDDPYATLLLEKDAEIIHLRSLLSLKETKAAEAISLRSQLSVVEAANAAKGTKLRDLKENNFALEWENNVLSKKVEALESVVASKEVNLLSLSFRVVNLTVDFSSFQLSRDEINSKKNSLKSAFELFKEQAEKMQNDQVDVLSDPKCLSSPEYLSVMDEAIDRSIDKGIQDGLAAGVSFSLLAQLEANKDDSMADIMDLLCLEGLAVIIRETSLAFSLEVAYNHVQRLRGDAAAHRLSLMDSILPLVEPLSARNLTGEATSPTDFTTAVTTTLSTTFVQTHLVHAELSTNVPLSPKVVFEEEELDTTPEHVPAL